jgi:hypothetical protein
LHLVPAKGQRTVEEEEVEEVVVEEEASAGWDTAKGVGRGRGMEYG